MQTADLTIIMVKRYLSKWSTVLVKRGNFDKSISTGSGQIPGRFLTEEKARSPLRPVVLSGCCFGTRGVSRSGMTRGQAALFAVVIFGCCCGGVLEAVSPPPTASYTRLLITRPRRPWYGADGAGERPAFGEALVCGHVCPVALRGGAGQEDAAQKMTMDGFWLPRSKEYSPLTLTGAYRYLWQR